MAKSLLLVSIAFHFLLPDCFSYTPYRDTSSCLALSKSFNNFLLKGDTTKAVAVFSVLFSSCSNPGKAVLYRGVMLYESLCADEKQGQGCGDTLLLIYKRLHQSEPTGSSAMKLAKGYSTLGRNTEAGRYFSEAMDLESDPAVKAEILMEMARHHATKLLDYEGARIHARRALTLRSNWAEPHIFIGNLYAASVDSCKNTIFKGKSCHWAAVDEYEKGLNADSLLESEIMELINSQKELFPSDKEIAKAGLKEGETFKNKCWIGEKTIVRSK